MVWKSTTTCQFLFELVLEMSESWDTLKIVIQQQLNANGFSCQGSNDDEKYKFLVFFLHSANPKVVILQSLSWVLCWFVQKTNLLILKRVYLKNVYIAQLFTCVQFVYVYHHITTEIMSSVKTFDFTQFNACWIFLVMFCIRTCSIFQQSHEV